MAEETNKSTARARWIIILALAGLGVYLYIRYRKQQQAATAPSPQPTSATDAAAANGQTQDTGVPVLNLAGSGTYQGPYTPYNIVNNGVQQPAGSMPGGDLTQSLANALQNGTPVSIVNNSNTAGGH